MAIPYSREIEDAAIAVREFGRTLENAGTTMAKATAEISRLRRIEDAARALLVDLDDCGDYVCIEEPKVTALELALDIHNNRRSSPDYDPTPWCSGCGAMKKADCHCGPLADNE